MSVLDHQKRVEELRNQALEELWKAHRRAAEDR
jgi:hypothetical protein